MRDGSGRPGAPQIPPDVRDAPLSPGLAHEMGLTRPHIFFTGDQNGTCCSYQDAEVRGFLDGSVVKNLPPTAGNAGPILWLGRSPGEGNGNPLQYS